MGIVDLDGAQAILAAIAAAAGAGAGDALKDMTKSAITGSRDRLVKLVRRGLKQDPLGEAKLTVYAADPTPANAQALRGHLRAAGIDHDSDVLNLAHEVLTIAGPAALAPGSVAASVINQINKEGGTGFIGGQHVHHHLARQTPKVTWELHSVRGSVFELRNAGDGNAHDVVVTAENALRFDPPESAGAWGPGTGREFFAAGSWQTGHPTIRVEWRTDLGEQRAWSRPLPR